MQPISCWVGPLLRLHWCFRADLPLKRFSAALFAPRVSAAPPTIERHPRDVSEFAGAPTIVKFQTFEDDFTHFETRPRTAGPAISTTAKAIGQPNNQAFNQVENTSSCRPSVFTVATRVTIQDISPERINPTSAGAKRAGINAAFLVK